MIFFVECFLKDRYSHQKSDTAIGKKDKATTKIRLFIGSVNFTLKLKVSCKN